MISIAIIEDEKPAVEAILALLRFCDLPYRIVGSAGSITAACELIDGEKPDLIFLDIHLSDCSGFDVLQSIRHAAREVIFTTAYDQHAIQAFEENAVGYLLKPISPDLFVKAVNRAHRLIKAFRDTAESTVPAPKGQEPHILIVTNKEGTYQLPSDQIQHVESSGSYSMIYILDGSCITVSKNIGQFEEELAAHGFFRCHRSFIVNLKQVQRVRSSAEMALTFQSGHSVPVSRFKRAQLVELIRNNQGRN